jgi:hypothetical protein
MIEGPSNSPQALVSDDKLDRLVEQDKQHPGEPFADTGPAIERILAAGAARRDLCLVLRLSGLQGSLQHSLRD